MPVLDFAIKAWAAWDGREDTQRSTAQLSPLLRRRISSIGRQALTAAGSLPDLQNARVILSSRHGEFDRTSSLLAAVINQDEVSPADFSLSVHHALAGLLSIDQKNGHGHTAIAAGPESFYHGLVEAIACLHEKPHEPALLIHFDEILPEPFAIFNNADDQPVVLAMALGTAKEGEAFSLNIEVSNVAKVAHTHAHDFIQFLQSKDRTLIAAGAQRQWRTTRLQG